MDSIFQAHGYVVPSHEILEAIAQRFSNTAERSGKVEVSAKQVHIHPIPRDDQDFARNLPLTPQPQPVHSTTLKSMPQVTHSVPAFHQLLHPILTHFSRSSKIQEPRMMGT